MTRYIRVYGNLIVVGAVAIIGILVTPILVSGVVGYLPEGARVAGGNYQTLVDSVVRLLIIVIAVLVLRFLISDKGRATQLHQYGLEDIDGAIELYRGFAEEIGVDPSVARRVIDMNIQMDSDERTRDFNRANIPNFSASLGQRLGVGAEDLAMMREFFATSAPDARRSFSTSTHVTMEGGRIEQHHETDAVVEPVSRFAPKDPENDPNWHEGASSRELTSKIFGDWNEGSAFTSSPLVEEATPGVADLGNDYTDKSLLLGGYTPYDDHEDRGDVDNSSDVNVEGPTTTSAELESEPEDHDYTSEEQTANMFMVSDLGEITDENFVDLSKLDQNEPCEEILLDEEDGWSEDEILHNGVTRLIGPSEPHWDDSDETDVVTDGSDGGGYYGELGTDADRFEQSSSTYDAVDNSEIPFHQEEIPIFSDDAIFAGVENDPVIAGLINAVRLTRRIPSTKDIRYIYAIYGGDSEMLITDLATDRTSHVDNMVSGIEPLYRFAGVRRHKTSTWSVDLSNYSEMEDGIDAVVWVPVGIAKLMDGADRTAWKLVGVKAGTSATFHVLPDSAALVAARLEWILGNLYDDLHIESDISGTHYFLSNLGVMIDLVLTHELTHGDFDLHGDLDNVAGPEKGEPHNLSLLGDGSRKWISTRLGIPEVDHSDWLPLLNMIMLLIMRVEPVSSSELLGQWATSGSNRGKELLDMLKMLFGSSLNTEDDEWILANVRLDIFWLEELLEDGQTEVVRTFINNKFDPGSLDVLLSLTAMDPRMRITEALLLEQKLITVLNTMVDALHPSAEGVLSEKLALIESKIKKG